MLTVTVPFGGGVKGGVTGDSRIENVGKNEAWSQAMIQREVGPVRKEESRTQRNMQEGRAWYLLIHLVGACRKAPRVTAGVREECP